MTSQASAITETDPKQQANCSSERSAIKLSAADQRERHFLDLIENDEVKEALRRRRLENQ